MGDDTEARQDLLGRIKTRRASINAFVRKVRSRSARLANLSIVSSALAAVFTAGPAVGGQTFAATAQQSLSLRQSSIVWQALCAGALAVSLVAAISTTMNKSQDSTARLSAAEACNAELEGLQLRVEFGDLPVQDAVKLYQQYVAKVPFVEEELAAAQPR